MQPKERDSADPLPEGDAPAAAPVPVPVPVSVPKAGPRPVAVPDPGRNPDIGPGGGGRGPRQQGQPGMGKGMGMGGFPGRGGPNGKRGGGMKAGPRAMNAAMNGGMNAPRAVPGPDQAADPATAYAETAYAETAEPDLTAEDSPPRPTVQPARLRRRHNWLMASFVLLVLLPSAAAVSYLYLVAVDQYASTLGFSVRTEETSAASSLLGGLSGLAGSSTTPDSDVLYEFIQSQEMVERVDARLNLRALYSKPEGDPVFRFPADGSIEDLVKYWQRVVSIAYDGGTGLIQIEVHAFAAADAQAVTQAIYDESTRMINELSETARTDTTRYANEDLATAEDRLKAARQALTAFRLKNQIVDPSADVQSQVGILGQLQSQLAEALITLDLLRGSANANDPRITNAEERISVIEKRIEQERQKFGAGGQGAGNEDFATVVDEYERLNADRDFAQGKYVAAMTALDAARAEAQRQSRYLAAFVRPTLAQTAEYPRRALLSLLAFLFLTLGWSIGALIYYSIRDRR